MKRKHVHIGSYGIIHNKSKIVLIRKARGGYTGKLDLPGGGIEHTESPEEALIRELKEETGSNVISYKLLFVKDKNIVWNVKDDYYEDLHHIGIIYDVIIKDNYIDESPDGIDSLGASWYKYDELNLDELTPFAQYAVTWLRNNNI